MSDISARSEVPEKFHVSEVPENFIKFLEIFDFERETIILTKFRRSSFRQNAPKISVRIFFFLFFLHRSLLILKSNTLLDSLAYI